MCTEFLNKIYKHSWENDYGYDWSWAYVQVLCGFKTIIHYCKKTQDSNRKLWFFLNQSTDALTNPIFRIQILTVPAHRTSQENKSVLLHSKAMKCFKLLLRTSFMFHLERIFKICKERKTFYFSVKWKNFVYFFFPLKGFIFSLISLRQLGKY